MRRFIVMGDIVGSSSYQGSSLNTAFHKLIHRCNQEFGPRILSPYTITLGDEFQGIPKDLRTAIDTLFFLEEQLLFEKNPPFIIRYVVYQGKIDTPINHKIAHGMMGEGLAGARDMLLQSKKESSRFSFKLDKKRESNLISNCFSVIGSIVDRWSVSDYSLITDMLFNNDDATIGKNHNRHRTSITRRRKTLMIKEYCLLKEAIYAVL